MTPSQAITILLQAGLTEAAIGQRVGASQSAINKIKRGVMAPTWEVGAALVRLAEEIPPANDDSTTQQAA